MSFHSDYEKWLYYSIEKNCPVCNNLPAPKDDVDIIEFPTSWLCAQPRVCLKGTCYLLLKPHAVELYDLEEKVLISFMKEAQISAKALKQVTDAIKINYEIHGNTCPHMHIHFFPRYLDDPFPNKPINYHKINPPVYQKNEFNQFVREMRKRIATLKKNIFV
ncbi:MAG: HIT family protein [Candidatus Thorarchaeota archaeon]